MKAKLAQLYRDYLNNFLSLEVFAEYYQITTEEKAQRVIKLGRLLHERGY
jgi:chromosome segregation and condensation protein ScpB